MKAGQAIANGAAGRSHSWLFVGAVLLAGAIAAAGTWPYFRRLPATPRD